MNLKDKIEKLNRVGTALSSEHDLDKLLDLIVFEARNLTGADAGSLYLKDGDYLYFKVSQNDTLEKRFGSRRDFFKPFNVKISKNNIAGYVTVTSRPLNIKDAYSIKFDEDYKHSKEFDQKFGYRTKSILTVPMVDHKDEVIGVLQLINALESDSSVAPFHKDYEDFVMSLASQAAVAINNARFIEEIKNLFQAIVQYSASAIDARSPHTAGHSERVAALAYRLAEAVKKDESDRFTQHRFSEQELEEIKYAGWLHDIGKIGVKEIVLDKPNKISDENLLNISYRFQTLLLQKYQELLETKIRMFTKTKGQTNNFRDYESVHENESKWAKENLDFIKRINVPTERMDASDVEKLKGICNFKFKNPMSGEDMAIIGESEFENLSVVRGSLNPKEKKEAQSHVEKSLKILEKIPFRGYLKNIPDIVAKHHEYLDGSGYPKGVKGEEISIQSRILCIVDIFDALVARDRPYKPAMPIETALGILKKDASQGKLDKNLVELFIEKKIYIGVY